jgi:phosphoadenosine phosphosulfate reductase
MTSSLSRLQTYYGHLDSAPLLSAMIRDEFAGKIGLVSSFGAGSALLLSMVAEVNSAAPVMFLDTEKHFPETLEYVENLKNKLGLTNVHLLHPDPTLLENIDKSGELWKMQPNRCCWLRKVEPLQRAMKAGEFEALITGRKRYQTPERADMQTIEMNEDGKFRVNPLAFWTKEMVVAEFKKRNLPEHPLVSKGYLSIGCAPCTRPLKAGEDERAGRWAHTAELPGGEKKVECGIHLEGMPTKPDWNI